MRLLVTGAAGFIGSHLVPMAVNEGHEVVAVDNFSDYYSETIKRANVGAWDLVEGSVDFHEVAISEFLSNQSLSEFDSVIHLAARPGVRPSWTEFERYAHDNLVETQVLLQNLVSCDPMPRFVYASSSSVYGNQSVNASDRITLPLSPYGVTKLAMERLVDAYANQWGLTSVALRYFTVYGPRQRPDMAFQKFIHAGLAGRSIPIYGDGTQVRDFTYVVDAVDATLRCATQVIPDGHALLDICGGGSVVLNDALNLIEENLGIQLKRDHQERQAGDPDATSGDPRIMNDFIGWDPSTNFEDGIRNQCLYELARWSQ